MCENSDRQYADAGDEDLLDKPPKGREKSFSGMGLPLPDKPLPKKVKKVKKKSG